MTLQNEHIDNTLVVVNDEPYCIWEVNLIERNKEFIEGIDTDYFKFISETFIAIDDKKRESIALRIAYHHALETMFSFIGAFVQSPGCVYAWLAKCSTPTLRAVIQRISKSDKALYTYWNIQPLTWESITEIIFQWYCPKTEKNKRTSMLFAKLWQRLADEYLDQKHIDEYNSLKHGLRIKSGGFTLAVGSEHKYGVPPPKEEMKVIGGSDCGTTYFKIESSGGEKNNRSLCSKRTSLNWRMEKVALLIQIISMSIRNIVSALQIVNGTEANTVQFQRPIDDSDFEKPWEFHTGVLSCNMDYVIDEQFIIPTTREELLKKIKTKMKSRNSGDETDLNKACPS